ncbi:MAG TPA: serine/threonine-protein kinase, partial [Gemmataceae bacterium]|nr:serine/threonine-protein kinase [Gemmataceae bacterium]
MDPATQTSPPPVPLGEGPDLTGRTVGDFRVLRRLGQGGMGQVYLAEQVSLKRKVALKILRPDLASDPTNLQRFKLEAESVARATHANIVQVYAVGEADGMPYMALEYVEGKNLREYLAKKGPPDLLLALSIMRQVAAALQRAGELGMVHRD